MAGVAARVGPCSGYIFFDVQNLKEKDLNHLFSLYQAEVGHSLSSEELVTVKVRE